NMELIRPLYLVEEEAIIRFMKNSGIKAIDCACTVTEKKMGSKREYIKELIKTIRSEHDNAGISIFRSAENVNLEAVVGWKDSSGKHSFLDKY
ncbi:MAG: tRNA 2-thiocytidine(32) synthetase TtcA, partial [Gallicola sp.]|nr:tRNA 2-thiocytidine(32) synthetase TtcA [Gallicola sp.]